MSASDAVTAQGMATRHRRSVEAVISGLDKVNALLAKMIKNNQIKWGGYGTNFEWYIRKLKETSSWNSGQLAVRSFEEKDPMVKCTLPYCFIDQTYGVSEKSIKRFMTFRRKTPETHRTHCIGLLPLLSIRRVQIHKNLLDSGRLRVMRMQLQLH
jgi:hypothetical protein